MIRLVVIADRRSAHHTLLSFKPSCLVVGSLDGQLSTGSRLVPLRPDVVLVDGMRNRQLALRRIREVACEVPSARCILLSDLMDEDSVGDALAAGAHAVISNSVSAAVLGILVAEIARGTIVQRGERPDTPLAGDRFEVLTPREREILTLVSRGMTNAGIARELWLTEQTVKFHLSNTYRKLGVSNRTEATHLAHKQAALTPPVEPTPVAA